MSTRLQPIDEPHHGLIAGLWIAQILVSGIFLFSAYLKLSTPIDALAQMMPWTGEASETFVRAIGLVDLAGGFGIIVPTLTRIAPRLTAWAAGGCVVLQILAAGFHVWRGEFTNVPLNILLLALAAFVLWGRTRPAYV